MLIMFNKIAFAVICCSLLAALSGCATNADAQVERYAKRDPSMSLARNIALSTSLTGEKGPLVDVYFPKDENNKELIGASNNVLNNSLNLAGMVGAGTMVAGSLSKGFLLGALLSSSELPHPALQEQLIAWMPQKLAADEKAASKIMKARLKEAFIKSLPEAYRYEEYEEISKPLLAAAQAKVYAQIIGPGCPSSNGFECRVNFYVNQPLKIEQGPEWVGGGGRYLWKNWKDGDKSGYNSASVKVYLAKPKDYYREGASEWGLAHGNELYIRMSAYLDDWVYLYIPPTKSRPYPVIYNAGTPFYFAKFDR